MTEGAYEGVYDDLPPLVLSLYDGAFNPVDWITEPTRVEAVVDFRGDVPGWLTFDLDGDDEVVDLLADPAEQMRVVLEYRYDPQNPRALKYLLGGLVTVRAGDTSAVQTRTFDVLDYSADVLGILGWPNPNGATIEQQGAASEYFTRSGPAESVLKYLVAANLPYVDLPVTIAPDLGRGGNISVKVRMHPLVDRLFPAVTRAGIGVTVQQVGAGLVLDCYEPATYVEELTEASGVVVGGSYSITRPTASRAVVMGQGEGTARVMAFVVDEVREAEYGYCGIVSVDARNSEVDQELLAAGDAATIAAYRAQLEVEGREALLEHAAKASVAAALAETDEFRFMVKVGLGDPVLVVLNGVRGIEDRVLSARFLYDAETGFTIEPSVGERADDPDEQMIDALADVSREQRDRNVGR